MVRRWSHINFSNFYFSSFYKFEKKHKIKTFRSLVNFKRFTFKITKFKRKGLARFKHTSNWMLYTNILKFWVLDYMFTRNLTKVQHFLNVFIDNLYVYDFNYMRIRNDMFSYNFNFYLSSLSKSIHRYFYKDTLSVYKYNSITFAWINEAPSFGNSVVPFFSEWDNLHYANNNNQDYTKTTFDFNAIFQSIFIGSLQFSNEFRKILIFLFFYKLNFKNVK